ncbi:unnamed protein product [Sphagnum jensenii]|uniref:Ribosomal protein S11 n=1 Tax=Sphagnum jensenii TaxID=128206 RepID=A0ABP1BEP6_9BRYO
MHNQQTVGGRLENANPARTNQSIGIDRSVYSAIKLSSPRGIHQCSKQGIGALNIDTRGSCTISRLGVDASRMLIWLVQTNRSVCSAIKLNSPRGIHQCFKQGIGALNNDTKGSCTISRLGVDTSRMLIRLIQTNRSGSIVRSVVP